MNGIGFTEKELQLQKTTIYSNIILSMNKIIQAMEMFKIEFDNPEREVKLHYILNNYYVILYVNIEYNFALCRLM